MEREKKAEEPEELKETSVKESTPDVIAPVEPTLDKGMPSKKFIDRVKKNNQI